MPHERMITTPDDSALDELCGDLSAHAGQIDASGAWPADNWRKLARSGALRWFCPQDCGGYGWAEAEVLRGYLRLSQACLTTTFVLTQWAAAVKRIVASGNQQAIDALLPDLLTDKAFATVGISHLTTSRQHLGRPPLLAEETGDGFVLDGYTPWVTSARHATTIVVGATLADGRQVLLALPTEFPGVAAGSPAQLVALSASDTGEVRFKQVEVPRKWLLAGPVENVMAGPTGANTGGLATSALALGLSAAAIAYLQSESIRRPDLSDPHASLAQEHSTLAKTLIAMTDGDSSISSTEMRARSNSLVLRSTQAALAAAKGAGFVAGHPTGRWCREALFFLVWSCPQPVMAANLCELAGLG